MARLLAIPLVLATLLLAAPVVAEETGDWHHSRRDRSLAAGDEVAEQVMQHRLDEPDAAATPHQPPANADNDTVNVGRWLSGWGPVDVGPIR
jgi:hypothetical protein